MGGGGDGSELRISPELLNFLFEPLSEVLKEQGQTAIEVSDQLKVLVTLVTAHPTRLTLAQMIEAHDKSAQALKSAIDTGCLRMEKFMWISGVIWAATATLIGWFHWGPK